MLKAWIRNKYTAPILFFGSVVVFSFYIAAYLVSDVYQYAGVGAIFELLWLPMLLCLVTIPVMAWLVLINNKGRARVYALLSLALVVASLVLLGSR